VRDGSWSIAEVARMSDVTSRTLRHYDAIGLLPPAWIGADGRR
jgi:DNA-binding transcriptional MerR regulator